MSRTLNPLWGTMSPGSRVRVSKFRIRKFVHWGNPYWNPLDLLGLFLSRTGPAPPNATTRCFFLPLTALYGRWCREIISGKGPYMYNCTWKTQPNGTSDFFLGASMSCYNVDRTLTGRWGTILRQARYRLVAGEFTSLSGWSFGKAPASEHGKSTKIGNCAETYPFLHLLR